MQLVPDIWKIEENSPLNLHKGRVKRKDNKLEKSRVGVVFVIPSMGQTKKKQ